MNERVTIIQREVDNQLLVYAQLVLIFVDGRIGTKRIDYHEFRITIAHRAQGLFPPVGLDFKEILAHGRLLLEDFQRVEGCQARLLGIVERQSHLALVNGHALRASRSHILECPFRFLLTRQMRTLVGIAKCFIVVLFFIMFSLNLIDKYI